MGVWKSFAGTYRIEITGGSPEMLIQKICQQGIDLYNVTSINALTICAEISTKDFLPVKEIVDRMGGDVKIQKRMGIYWSCVSLIHRPVLVFGIALLIILSLYLPTRVLFVCVEGNKNIPSRKIIACAESCGIRFGASRRAVRSEKMKNALLSVVPELQWAGVNTRGCVAVISVRERSDTADTKHECKGISSIVAVRDGVIQEITVKRGNAQCSVGQAVKMGQVLISGYTDCGIAVKGETADGEVMAQTNRVLQVITPTECTKRTNRISENSIYQLRVGKNIINFCKDSGISDTTCVKMYEEIPLVLPGGFQLPVSLIKTSCTYFENTGHVADDPQAYGWMSDSAEAYLKGRMISGSILTDTTSMTVDSGRCIFTGMYACSEMIGQVRYEELIRENG